MHNFLIQFEEYCKTPGVDSGKARSYAKAIEYLCDCLHITKIDKESVSKIIELQKEIYDKDSLLYNELFLFLSNRGQKSYLEKGYIKAALKPFFVFSKLSNLDNWIDCFEAYIKSNQKSEIISFKDGFIKREEGYKEEVFYNAQSALELSSWSESVIGKGDISRCVKKAVSRLGNLVNHNQIIHFKNIVDAKLELSEQAIYKLYCGNDDAAAFEKIVELFGARYDLVAGLFFMKDMNKYLPARSSEFDKRFKLLGIHFYMSNKCSWDNYNRYLKIVDKIRIELQKHYKTEFDLIDAHTFLWMILHADNYSKKIKKEEEFKEIAKASPVVFPELKSDRIDKIEHTVDSNLVSDISKVTIDSSAPKYEYQNKPKKKAVPVIVSGHKTYPRDRKVALNALSHAGYVCEIDENHESFIRKNSTEKYTEPHHLIPMSFSDEFEHSLDVEENIVSLCSNCHNQIHYGRDARELIENLFSQRRELLKKVGLEITLEKLLLMYNIG